MGWPVAKWPFNTEKQPDWSFLQDVGWTGAQGSKSYLVSGNAEFADGAVFAGWSARGGQVTVGASSGHTFTYPVGAPLVADLDVLLVKLDPGATLTAVSSAGGAAWTLQQFQPNYSGAWRTASGGEPSTVLIVTSAAVMTRMHWSRFR